MEAFRSAAQLFYDLDCDGEVGVDDMALLVGTYWSASTKIAVVPTICACPLAEAMSSGLMDEATALAALGFAGWSESCDWLAIAEPGQADSVCDMLAELIRGDPE